MKEAIAAGVFNDLGSGSNVDLCVITKDAVEYCQPFECLNIKGTRQVAWGKSFYRRSCEFSVILMDLYFQGGKLQVPERMHAYFTFLHGTVSCGR